MYHSAFFPFEPRLTATSRLQKPCQQNHTTNSGVPTLPIPLAAELTKATSHPLTPLMTTPPLPLHPRHPPSESPSSTHTTAPTAHLPPASSAPPKTQVGRRKTKTQHTAHLGHFPLIQLLPLPRFPLNLLRIQLPLGEEPNLYTVSLTHTLSTPHLLSPSHSPHPIPFPLSPFPIPNPSPPPPIKKGKKGGKKGKRKHTKCTGFSTPLCARNSCLTYSSPSTRISAGRCLRCARSSRRYSGIGGRRLSPAARREARGLLGAEEVVALGARVEARRRACAGDGLGRGRGGIVVFEGVFFWLRGGGGRCLLGGVKRGLVWVWRWKGWASRERGRLCCQVKFDVRGFGGVPRLRGRVHTVWLKLSAENYRIHTVDLHSGRRLAMGFRGTTQDTKTSGQQE